MKSWLWRRGHSGRSTPLFSTETDMTLLNLTFLILNLNYMIDHGRRASLDEIKQRIDRGGVLDWIGRLFNRRADACPYLHDRGAYEEITLGLRQMLYMIYPNGPWRPYGRFSARPAACGASWLATLSIQ